jgi:hypothetical protein
MATTTTTTRTTVVTEVPDERHWQGRDWIKALVAGGLALSLLRPGVSTAPVASPTAVAVAPTLPVVVGTVVPPIGLPGAAAPLILSTREAVQAGPYTIQGTGTPGALVEVLVNGASVGTATVGEDGRWSLPTTLEAGPAELVAQVVNEAGTVIIAADPVALNVNAPAVEPPVLLIAGAAAQPGSFEILGTGTPGALVEVLLNGASIGTATVGADGRWSLPAILEAGTAEVVARTVDASGAVLAAGEPVSLDVGAASVSVPTFDVPSGDLTGGPGTLSGTGTPGTRVRVTVGGRPAGTAVVGPDGAWSLDTILSAGRQPVVVEALDEAGATVGASAPVEINVVGGLGVTVSVPAEGTVLQPGPVTISGNGAAGTDLEILDGDKVLGATTVGADNTWTTEVTLEQGTSAISVREAGTDQILVRPTRVTVGEAPTVSAACGAALSVGCQAWVTREGGLQLRLRSAAAITPDNIITRLPIGSEMTLEEGPQDADGYTWWRITTEGGNTGWVAGENLVTQPD